MSTGTIGTSTGSFCTVSAKGMKTKKSNFVMLFKLTKAVGCLCKRLILLIFKLFLTVYILICTGILP